MKATEILSAGALNDLHLAQLVDTMDPAIGEASSVMGAMATEVIRRSLRGGVLQIGRELSTYVGQQVAFQIDEQRPMIEKAAAEMATEVARAEVEDVRRLTHEQGEHLGARIEDASRQAIEKAEGVARDLSGRLEETAKETKLLTQDLSGRLDETSREAKSLAQELSGRLDETAREAQSRATDLSGRLEQATRQTEEVAEKLTVRIEDTARHADETTTSLARTLETEVVAVETRTLDTARKEFKQQIEEVRDRARKATTQIKERLEKLDLASEQFAEAQAALKRELLATVRAENETLLEKIEELTQSNEDLAARVAVLERPRGIRGFFARLFGRGKK